MQNPRALSDKNIVPKTMLSQLRDKTMFITVLWLKGFSAPPETGCSFRTLAEKIRHGLYLTTRSGRERRPNC